MIAEFRRAQESTRVYWTSRIEKLIADRLRPDLADSSSIGPADSSSIDFPPISASMENGVAPSETISLDQTCGSRVPGSTGDIETIGEYRLLAFLGRGCRGEVHLAVQSRLADRPVVLKLIPQHGREHLSLASLQHPHIMPLYGVQDLEERRLRVMCMPYLGGVTLARLLALVSDTPARHRTGRGLIEGLDQLSSQSPVTMPAHGPAREYLLHASYDQAVCWIGVCLAEALQHAHGLGIVHLDLKPSNVLIAADGRPILLDFHLARPVIRPGEVAEPIGGTPLYMSPEQGIALQDARCGRAASVLVDGRSDLYSLGAMLLEMLGGTIPHRGTASSIRRQTRAPRELARVLARCLAKSPDARYPDAASLATDLKSCLAELSTPARASRRRGPRPHPRFAMAVGLLKGLAWTSAVLLMAGLIITYDLHRRTREARAALGEGHRLIAARAYDEAMRTLSQGLAHTEPLRVWGFDPYLPGIRDLSRSLGEQLHQARAAREAESLHELVDRIRFLYGMDLTGRGVPRTLAAGLRAAWSARGRAAEGLAGGLDPDQLRRLRADLQDLALLWADLRVRLAGSDGERAAREEALQILAEAEVLLGPSSALESERRIHALAPGEPEPARVSAAVAGPEDDPFLVGRRLLASGDLQGAARELGTASDLRPQDLWTQFYRGTCSYRLRHFEDAVAAFSICIALSPGAAECYFNRGRSFEGLGRTDSALRDYDRALRLAPGLAGAALARGILRCRAGLHAEAIADFREALRSGADAGITHYNLAIAYLGTGNRTAALESVQRALTSDPGMREARELVSSLRP
jgi:serine/threonine protein kinase/tetratricopeptide (TPR) repeat protein